jgi:hypothetical protein
MFQRGDLFEKRCRLMAEWAAYCNTLATSARNKVVLMRRRAPRRAIGMPWGRRK